MIETQIGLRKMGLFDIFDPLTSAVGGCLISTLMIIGLIIGGYTEMSDNLEAFFYLTLFISACFSSLVIWCYHNGMWTSKERNSLFV